MESRRVAELAVRIGRQDAPCRGKFSTRNQQPSEAPRKGQTLPGSLLSRSGPGNEPENFIQSGREALAGTRRVVACCRHCAGIVLCMTKASRKPCVGTTQ